MPRPLARLSLAAAILFVVVFTLLPSREPAVEPMSLCMFCGERVWPDVLLNVALFAPLGAALAAVGMRLRPALLTGALLSACVELAQVWIPGRDPSVRDVLSNTLGTWAGALLVASAGSWLWPSTVRARWLAAGWTAAAVSAAWVTLLLFQPAYPASVYYGQWTANLGSLVWYRGEVLGTEVGPLAVPAGRWPDPPRLRQELLSQSPIVIRAIAGPPVPSLGPLFSIYDHREREIILIGPDRDDLVYRYRSRGSALSFLPPDYRARGLLNDIRPGDSLRVVVTHQNGEVCLSVNSRRACQPSHGPEAGWSLLYSPDHLPGWLVTLISAAWLVVLAAPAGYWSRGKRTLAVVSVVLLTGTAWPSAQWGAAWSQEALWTAVGLGLGAWLHSLTLAHRDAQR